MRLWLASAVRRSRPVYGAVLGEFHMPCLRIRGEHDRRSSVRCESTRVRGFLSTSLTAMLDPR
jgi:hypothetical protein